MSVKPELAFDVCWEVYRGAREVLETKRGISALNWKDTGKFLWRPDFRARLNEWVADFRASWQVRVRGTGLGITHGAVPPLLPGAGAV
jgi:hypothetical protein